MKILIIGDGKVGYAIAEQLSLENHDITIVDNNEKALNKAVDKLDVLCVQGSASSKSTLLEAEVDKMDVVIVVTSSDELNMVSAMLANKLSDARIIARIRDPEYIESEDFIKETIGIDMLINPELTAAGEISRLLRFPYAISRESLASGRVELIEFPIPENSPVINSEISVLLSKLKNHSLICLATRGGKIFTPDGSTRLMQGDHIFVIGMPYQNVAFTNYLGFTSKKIRTVMIVGGSRIAYYLASQLEEIGMTARIIENDQARCNELLKHLPNSVIISGDGTDHDLLEQEQITLMDAFVALTNHEENNILTGLFAKDCEVPKVVIKVTRPYYSRITEGMSTINPKDLTAGRIVRYVRSIANSEGSFVERLYRIAGGQAEALQFTVKNSSSLVIGKPLKTLKLKKGLIIAAIIHKDRTFIPHGDSVIHQDDTVIIVTSERHTILDINDILM